MEALPILALLLVGSVGSVTFYWARDLFESGRAILTEPGADEAMEQVTVRYAFARIVVLAALADDEVIDEEWAILRRLYDEHPDFDDDPEQVLSQIRFMQESVGSRDELERRVRVEAELLGPRLRRAAFQAAVAVAATGGGFRVRRGGAFRSAPQPEGEALVELLARALEVSESDRVAALEYLSARG